MLEHGAPIDDPLHIAELLGRGARVTDGAFDSHLPVQERRNSARCWSPVRVATLAARWLGVEGAKSILDVGAGAGKFCVVAAASSSLRFTGIERRADLVGVASRLAGTFGVTERARFVAGELTDVDWARFDGLYLYNPFIECFEEVVTSDDARARYEEDVCRIEHVLAVLPQGTTLVTFNGYGGRIPDSWDLLHAVTIAAARLRLWKRTRASSNGTYWIESEEQRAW